MTQQKTPMLTLAQAAAIAGFEGVARYAARRLMRLIVAKEKATKQKILVRTKGPKGKPRYLISPWILKQRMPELFDRRDDAERAARLLVREEISGALNKLASLDAKVSYMGKRMAAMLRQELARKGPPRTVEKHLGGGRGLGRGMHTVPQPASASILRKT